MDRRQILRHAMASLAIPAFPALPAWAFQDAGAYPPIDSRSVWLIGDSAPPDPHAAAVRLAELTQADGVRDAYLTGGAVANLEQAFASLLGKEACAFFPSGTLANQVAIRLLAGDASRALVQQESHVYRDESDGVPRLSNINLVPMAPGRASPTAEEVAAILKEAEGGPFPLRFGAISIESPVRRAQGELVPFERLQEIAALARTHGARLHLDGARLLLAPPGYDLARTCALFDTVYVSLYKYLDAPFGAVLAGDATTIAAARTMRHVFGGSIYQGSAPALLALDSLETFRPRIADAHRAANALIASLEAAGKARQIRNPNASNILKLEMDPKLIEAAISRGRAAGVRIGSFSKGEVTIFVNTTILRRPVSEYIRIFLG